VNKATIFYRIIIDWRGVKLIFSIHYRYG